MDPVKNVLGKGMKVTTANVMMLAMPPMNNLDNDYAVSLKESIFQERRRLDNTNENAPRIVEKKKKLAKLYQRYM